MAENENNEPQENGQEQQAKRSRVANRNSQVITKKVKESFSKYGKNKAANQAVVKALGRILVTCGWFILVIILVIGIIMFFLTMPGMVMEKLKGLFKSVGNAWCSWWGTDDATQFNQVEVYNVLNYLDEMGYDLKGYGFITEYLTDPNTQYDKGGAEGDDVPKDDRKLTSDGVIRDKGNKIVTGYSDFITTYLVSENRIFTIKNKNVVTEWYNALGVHFWDNFINMMAFKDGMLAFYYDTGTVGKNSGRDYKDNWFQSIDIDAESKKLSIKRGWFNSAMSYSLDGWTGRYGMPVDFLLTVHLATQMPDLAYDMVQTFNTQINILLYKSEGTVEGQYRNNDGSYVSYSTINKELNGLEGKNWFSKLLNCLDNLGVSAAEAQKAIELGIIPDFHDGSTCGCTVSTVDVYIDDSGVMHAVQNRQTTSEDTTIDPDTPSRTTSQTTEEWYYLDWDNTNGEQEVIIDPNDITQGEMLTKLGDGCKQYMKTVLSALNRGTDFHYKTYTPYIENVTRHWYRDVYFVANPNKINSFVDYDYQYELITGERWTLYETYTSNPKDGELYNPEKEGEFVYYELNSDGSTGKRYDKNVTSGEISITDEEGNEETVRRASVGEDGELLVKKAKTIDLSEKYEDLGWNDLGNGYYSAYSNDTNNVKSYERAYLDEDIANEEQIDKEALERIYVEVEIGNVTQTGEGLRTETNSDIKKMFMSNKYFKYDGSRQKAEIIYALRKAIPKSDYSGYGRISDDILENSYYLTFDNGEYTSEAENKEYKLGDYVGSVSFQQDALNTFAMLENSHTLDADYIYKDFKELVVELGYFDKEELTESKPKLLQWIVPEIGSGGYPDRTIDKREEEYGTMIHSKADIDANKRNTLMNLIVEAIEAAAEPALNGQSTQIDPANGINVEATARLNASINDSLGEIGLSNTNSQNFVSLGSATSSNSGSSSLLSLDEWWEETQKIFDVYKSESWTYALDHSCNTFEIAESSGRHTTDCSLNASWMLQKLGALQEDHTFSSHMGHTGTLDESLAAAQDLLDAGAEVIAPPAGTKFANAANSGELEPGDVLFYDGHVSIYCGDSYDSSGITFCWDTGSTEGIQCGGPRDTEWESRDIMLIIRLPIGNQRSSGASYEGYLGNEAVVSPVTGILMEYGTYDEDQADENRQNIDIKYGGLIEGYTFEEKTVTDPETGEETKEIEYPSDKVGYAVIKVLDAETYKKLESSVNNKWKSNSLVKINEKSTDYDSANKHVAFKEETEELVDENRYWTKVEETVYGYKEFAEQYEQFGIGGYYIYIDGFRCEGVGEATEEDGVLKITTPGDELTIDSFKISESQVNDDNFEPATESLYQVDEVSKLVSKEYYNKLKAESTIKADASIGITFNYEDIEVDEDGNTSKVENEYILIKQGTVLGRTLIDQELLEGADYRDSKYGTYQEYIDAQNEAISESTSNTTTSTSSDPDQTLNKVPLIGNYLRIIMQDKDGSIVENVEDYMKIDDGGSSKQELDDEKFLYWMGVYIEGGNLEQSGDKWVSKALTTPGDSGGPTHFFGLAQSGGNWALAQKLGYKDVTESNWAQDKDFEIIVDIYLALIDEQKAKIKSDLEDENMPDGYLQAFISVFHNYGNLTNRGDEYKANKNVSETTWTTYNGAFAEALRKRRMAEWLIITEGKYMNAYEGNTAEIDFTDGGKYSEEMPFTDFCKAHGVNNIEVKKPEE